jgi:uncharacterized protein
MKGLVHRAQASSELRMDRREFFNGLAILPLAGHIREFQGRTGATDYPISPVSYLAVEIRDCFWAPRIEATRTVAVPYFFDYSAGSEGGYQDMRVIEGACYFLAKRPDPDLRALVESRLSHGIAFIRRLQEMKWPSKWDGSTLPAGDFFLAAIAYEQATGSRKLLDIAIGAANALASSFGPDKRHDIASHEGVEFALVSLYRATGDVRYVRLAKFFIDERGSWRRCGRRSYGAYAQDEVPIEEQTRAIGHCVRATYLYNGLTDVVALTGYAGYARAVERIWEDALSKRTYLTGGVGSYRHLECYGDDYDLPNLGCWNEICAACGNVWWNHRLFLLTGDSKYVDVMERTLYNGVLAGVSLTGDRHLYQTPLKAYGNFERHLWFGPECCPPNITRLLASLGGLIYAYSRDSLYINLFVGSDARLKLHGVPVRVRQQTPYPWQGTTRVIINPERDCRFSILVRIPGWARNAVMPGQLYRYSGSVHPGFTLTVNGRAASHLVENGFAKVERLWSQGDVVELNCPMRVQKVLARDQVADDRAMLALERGPLVFCAEGVDNQGHVFNLLVPESTDPEYVFRKDILGGVGTLTGNVQVLNRAADGISIEARERVFTAIPFYAFGNRDPGEMAVWLASDKSKVELPPAPTIASTSYATSSCGNGTVADDYPGYTPPSVARRWYPNAQDGSGGIRAIYDQIEPVNSEDESSYFLRLRPQSGDHAWVQYDFAKPARVSSVEVYWKHDKQYVVLPKAWHLLYKNGNDWTPVRTAGPYGVESDKFNRVEFEPVLTPALRMEIQLHGIIYKQGALGPPDGNWVRKDYTWYEGGVVEWRVIEA